MFNEEIEIVLEQYEAISRPYQIRQLSNKGVWVVNEQYVVKRIKNENLAKNICVILDSLNSDRDFTGNYICTSNGQAIFWGIIGNFIVYKYIRGESFKIEEALEAYDFIGKTIGRGLARLHSSFALFEKGKFESADTMIEYDDAVQFLSDKGIILPIQIIDECELFKTIYKSLPRQLIHRDIHLNNIIVDNKHDVHFIDFDSCEINIRIYDIAYFGVTTLEAIDNIKTELKRWQVLFAFFLEGYCNEIKLNQDEFDSIWKMFLVLQICFIRYYYEKDNNKYDAEIRINKLICVYNHRKDFGFINDIKFETKKIDIRKKNTNKFRIAEIAEKQ